MIEDTYEILDASCIAQVFKCEGGALVIGKIWERTKDEEGFDTWASKVRAHIATSDAAVAKLVKDYLRLNIRNENGILDEDD